MKLYIYAVAVLFLLSGCGTQVQYVKVDNSLKYTDRECKKIIDTEIQKIDRIVVYKKKRKLLTYSKGEKIGEYRISLGKNGDKGHKERIGDNKTPEGSYSVAYKQYSRNYYKSLKISYPNQKDREKARAKGVNPGGYIMIHGQPRWNADGRADSYMLSKDWTAGCIALTNKSMDKIFYAVENGVKIEIQA